MNVMTIDSVVCAPQNNVTNFLRYPGSKRRMLSFLATLLPSAESIEGRYVEPFVGGGAVFLFISPKEAFLSDINPDLIDLYRGIRLDAQAVWNTYSHFGRTKKDYQRIRSNVPRLLVKRAARVLFLNRTCFKGMWRHNLKGGFNVGYGGQARRWVIDSSTLKKISECLQHTKIRCCDFEQVIDSCEEGDFLFLDPPYRPGEREQINDHYIGRQFTYDDHRRLASALTRANSRRVQWLMTTSSHPDIRKLFRSNRIISMPRGTGRLPGRLVKDSGEIVIANYLAKGVHST
jgi:DNA adenine methylase